MYSVEFCYWVQGYFELASESSAISDNQVICIKKHIKLVKEVEQEKTGEFIIWLEGVLDSFDVVVAQEITESEDVISADLNWADNEERKALTKIIKERLAEVFKHTIDKSYGSEKLTKELDKIHNGSERRVPRWDRSTPITC